MFIFDLSTCELVDMHKKAHESAIYSLVKYGQVGYFGTKMFSFKNGIISCGSDKKARFWDYDFITSLNGYVYACYFLDNILDGV